MSLLRPTDARAAWSVTAGGKNSARSGDPAGMPPDRQAVVALPQARHADDVAPEIVGALEAQGLHPAEQSVSAGFTVDEPKATLAMRSSYRRGTRRGAEIVAALAPLRRPPTRQSVAPPPRRCSRKILPCAPAAQFIPSLRTRPQK